MAAPAIAKIAEVASKAAEALSKASAGLKHAVAELDKPLSADIGKSIEKVSSPTVKERLGKLDKPIKETASKSPDKVQSPEKKPSETKKLGAEEVMETQIVIEFKCPPGVDKKEFIRQIKGQERGLNSQTIAENMDNRAAFEKRKAETGTGRDLSEGKKAQETAREKAYQSRIESNQKQGMSYAEAKAEASEWLSNQAALHNPDQIAGGDPSKVSRMGDKTVNQSIGSQWRSKVNQLSDGIEDYAKGKTRAELEQTKLNVKLVVV